ncbi:TetR family transcriptional regulator [Luminiphilus sp.]|jgi:AcrR family transcriptional regulator|nr:TetR/AcrR family transcriptional regulator [Pseudomonadales bacterium]MDA8656477.1 TetR family transcriptional regulator [Luminiphilus sp.]MDA8815499.1 TetR family transcriptional regulator [Luminiphilus sp.]MDA9836508.1 TetR family transcriptional regulator [Luminiphilus sp.]MDB2312520.1 TetR family transcriptional regulator [Luminiphilus sp.]
MAQKPTKTRASAKAQIESKIKAAARPRQRAVQERAEITIEKIRVAAIRLFAERGYDGTSIREVENVAGVNRGLVNYHFDNKEALWKAALDQVFGLLETHTKDRAELYRDLPPKERIAYVIRSQVRFNAAHPELNQLMMQEAKSDTPRLHYIVDTYVRPIMEWLQHTAMEALPIEQDEFLYWYYMFLGSSTTVYSMAPESKLLFGVDVMEEKMIDRHVALTTEFLLTRIGGETAK